MTAPLPRICFTCKFWQINACGKFDGSPVTFDQSCRYWSPRFTERGDEFRLRLGLDEPTEQRIAAE